MAEQAFALERLGQLVDAELWCPRQRREWTAMLSAMVWAMDWRTGLIVGITREHLAAVTGRSVRSVSRMWRWAQDAGLLVRVEEGASSEWLGTRRNRSAAFVVVAQDGAAAARRALRDSEGFAQLTGPVDQSGNPPASYVGIDPLERIERSAKTPTTQWLWWRIPEVPSQRRAAAAELLGRTGLDEKRIDSRRLHGLLLSWWEAGASPAGLLHMLDHHPDQPDVRLGPAFLGARDPLAVMGYRLAPWAGRLAELPASAQGRRGDYLTAQKARLAALIPAKPITPAIADQAHSGALSPRHTRPHGRVLPRRAQQFTTPASDSHEVGMSVYERALSRARSETRSASAHPRRR